MKDMEKMEKMYVESHNVAEQMIKHGGSFVKELGNALLHADYENSVKIEETWPEYWKQYLEMSKQ